MFFAMHCRLLWQNLAGELLSDLPLERLLPVSFKKGPGAGLFMREVF